MKTFRWITITFVFVIFLGLAASTAVHAGEWPAEAKAQMDAAGARLRAANTTSERVMALREIEQIAAAYPDAPEARLTARLMAEKATQEAGPANMLAALEEYASAGDFTDVETFGSIGHGQQQRSDRCNSKDPGP